MRRPGFIHVILCSHYFSPKDVSVGVSSDVALVLQPGLKVKIKYEPRHEISNNGVYATSKASDQPAQTRSLIRAYASRLSIL